jgi:hypothetical protein
LKYPTSVMWFQGVVRSSTMESRRTILSTDLPALIHPAFEDCSDDWVVALLLWHTIQSTDRQTYGLRHNDDTIS